jgi:hypothetical protein
MIDEVAPAARMMMSVHLRRRIFRKIRIQMIDDISKGHFSRESPQRKIPRGAMLNLRESWKALRMACRSPMGVT